MPSKTTQSKSTKRENPAGRKPVALPKGAPQKVSRELALAQAANAIITNAGKNMKVGAPVSGTQVHDVIVALGRTRKPQPKIVKSLRDYASGKLSISALDPKARELLASVGTKVDANAVKMGRKPKSWPRKNAGILSALYSEKAPRKPATPKAAPKVEAPASSESVAA